MLKLLMWVGILLLVGGVIGGVVEIRWHGDRAAQVPQTILGAIGDGSIRAKTRVWATRAKRFVEQRIIKNDDQKLSLAISYVADDAAALDELLSEKIEDIATVIPASELLLESISRVSEFMTKVDAAGLAAVRSDANAAAAAASDALLQLQAAAALQEARSEQLQAITSQLEDRLSNLVPATATDKESAPSKQSSSAETASPTDEPTSIPLEF